MNTENAHNALTLARQQALFARQVQGATSACAPYGYRQGMDVYRRNLRAVSVAALGVTYPTAQRLLGDAGFADLAAQLLRQHPPVTGDWGEWGRELPSLIRASQAGSVFPFLAPVAELDWLRHIANRAADTRFDPSTLDLLESHELDAVGIRLANHTGLASSVYPLVEIIDRQTQPEALDERKTVSPSPRHVLVYRDGFRVRQRYITPAEHRFLLGLRAGQTVGHLLESSAVRGFDFPDWLARAIGMHIITHLYST